MVIYVVTRPGRELLFTVVTQDEKYKAKVCINFCSQFPSYFHTASLVTNVTSQYILDTIHMITGMHRCNRQRLGDATAAGMYKLLSGTLNGSASTTSLYALPVRIMIQL